MKFAKAISTSASFWKDLGSVWTACLNLLELPSFHPQHPLVHLFRGPATLNKTLFRHNFQLCLPPKPMNFRCHISECRAKFYLTDKRLIDSHSKRFASLFDGGDETILTVYPLCSSPRLPITNVFIHLRDEQLFICGTERETFVFLFASFFGFFVFLPCTVSTCILPGESQM